MKNPNQKRKCIYCRKEKSDSDFTLEHVLPKFIGGAYAPSDFKVSDVCMRCNNNLGLFVDAGFEKNWIVSNRLAMAARTSFNPNNKVGLPLICMGKSDLVPPQLKDGEICELWLGPLGEQIYWIRPNDERLYWYVGGNPITTKQVSSRAYFMFSEHSTKNPKISWLTFRDAFEDRLVRKIICTEVVGGNPADIGFEVPDELDELRIEFFKAACLASQTRENRLSIYTLFDFRFLAKLGIGISYSLFGAKALQTIYAEELYRALWSRDEDSSISINATTPFTFENDQYFSQQTGENNAVTITILPSPEGIAVCINIGAALNWVVKCASLESLTTEDIAPLKGGRVIVLYRQLQRGIDITLPEYLAHKCGSHPHGELTKISNQLAMNQNYFKQS